MTSPLDLSFNETMLDIYRKAKSEAKYNAIRFLQMVTDHAGTETAHILINSPTVSEGYTALWERTENGLVNMNTRSEALTTPMLDRAALSLPLQGVEVKRALVQGY